LNETNRSKSFLPDVGRRPKRKSNIQKTAAIEDQVISAHSVLAKLQRRAEHSTAERPCEVGLLGRFTQMKCSRNLTEHRERSKSRSTTLQRKFIQSDILSFKD